MTSNYSIRAASWIDNKSAIQDIRTTVFIQEQNVPEVLEWDEEDDQCYHWLAYKENNVIGYCRMLSNGHIGRMAVLKNYRRQGVGRALLDVVLEYAKSQQFFECFLYAQLHAIPFYERSGFLVTSDVFQDAGISHKTMRLQLADQRLLGVHGGDFSVDNLAKTALELIEQTHKQLRILSLSLDPQVFDSIAMADTLSRIARASRYNEIKIMVIDPQPLVHRGHRLLNLQRRLPSKIQLRRCTAHTHDIKNNLIIADHLGIIIQSIKTPDNIIANFNNLPLVENQWAIFDDFWEHAVVDSNLRQLDL